MKPLRAAAVIRTDHGFLLGGDSYKDWHRQEVLDSLETMRANATRKGDKFKARRYFSAKTLVQEQGRLSLIGGSIDSKDYLDAEVEGPIDVESAHFHQDLDVIMRYIRKAIEREVREETKLEVDPDSIEFLHLIRGENRNHLLCTVYAQGEIILDPKELLGLGMFTNKPPATPKNRYFYQQHAISFHNSFSTDETLVKKLRKMPVSRVRVQQELIRELYRHQCEGHAYAMGSKHFHDRQVPTMLRTTRNFEILGKKDPSAKPAQIPPHESVPETNPLSGFEEELIPHLGLRKALAKTFGIVESPMEEKLKVVNGRKR